MIAKIHIIVKRFYVSESGISKIAIARFLSFFLVIVCGGRGSLALRTVTSSFVVWIRVISGIVY